MAEKNDQLNCSICLSDFKKPKILECFHTFCECCLSDYIRKFEDKGEFMCPLCRKSIQIPEGGVSQFAGNIYVTDNFHETDDSPEKTPSCDVCQKGVESEFQCKDCDKFLCGSCKITHDSFAGCLKHDVVCLSEKTEAEETKKRIPIICKQHGKKFAVFCMNCSLVICSKCSEKDHSTHDVQNVTELGDMVGKGKQKFEEIREVFEEKLQDLPRYTSAIEEQLRGLKRETNEACINVDRKVQEVYKAMRRQSDKIKQEIKNSAKLEEFKLKQILDYYNSLISELETHSKLLSDDVEHGDSIDVLTVLPDLEDKLDKIEKQKLTVPSVTLPQLKHSRLDENNLFEEIGLQIDTPVQEGLDLSFSVDEFIMLSDNDENINSVNFFLDGYTLYFKLCNEEGMVQINLQSVSTSKYSGFLSTKPSIHPSFSLINKDKTKSICKRFISECSDVIEIADLTDKATGFINENSNITFRLRSNELPLRLTKKKSRI